MHEYGRLSLSSWPDQRAGLFPRRCPPLFLAPRFSPVAVPQRWTGGAVSNTPDRFLSRRQVEARCGIGRSMIYKLLKDGGFPAPFKISRSAVRWSEREIAEWLASRPRAVGRHPNSKAAAGA